MDDDTDAKIILTALTPKNWKRPPGRPRITWLNTYVQRGLITYSLTLNEAVDLAQNRPLWRLMSSCLRTLSFCACQKRRRKRKRRRDDEVTMASSGPYASHLRTPSDLVNCENLSGLTALEIAQYNGHQLSVSWSVTQLMIEMFW